MRTSSRRLLAHATACSSVVTNSSALICFFSSLSTLSPVGAPGGTRTPNLELRMLLLYPVELQAHFSNHQYTPTGAPRELRRRMSRTYSDGAPRRSRAREANMIGERAEVAPAAEPVASRW